MDEMLEQTDVHKPAPGDFRVGDRIVVKAYGGYHPVTVTKVNNRYIETDKKQTGGYMRFHATRLSEWGNSYSWDGTAICRVWVETDKDGAQHLTDHRPYNGVAAADWNGRLMTWAEGQKFERRAEEKRNQKEEYNKLNERIRRIDIRNLTLDQARRIVAILDEPKPEENA